MAPGRRAATREPCKLRPSQAVLAALLCLAVMQAFSRVHVSWPAFVPHTKHPAVPSERADGAAGSSPATPAEKAVVPGRRLLLCSHGRLMWLDVESGETQVRRFSLV